MHLSKNSIYSACKREGGLGSCTYIFSILLYFIDKILDIHFLVWCFISYNWWKILMEKINWIIHSIIWDTICVFSLIGHVSLGAYSDSFYEYLLKVWLVTNKRDTESRDMFYDAIDVCLGREGGRGSDVCK